MVQIHFSLPFQKGVKRKADAMAPMIGNSNFESFSPGEKMGKISSRRESGRQIKKVNKDLPDSQVTLMETTQVNLSPLCGMFNNFDPQELFRDPMPITCPRC